MKTTEIFPTVIARSHYDNFCIQERTTLIKEKYVTDQQFAVTEDTYVLDKTPLLKKWLQSQLDEYVETIMRTNNRLVITQSWCLMHSGVPQKLYAHRHSNSIISGSFYVVAPENTQGISFYKNSAEKVSDFPLLDWEVLGDKKEAPSWLRAEETFQVEESDLILFQSHLSHGVRSDHIAPRLVLAFNTWFVHPIGETKKLNRLFVRG